MRFLLSRLFRTLCQRSETSSNIVNAEWFGFTSIFALERNIIMKAINTLNYRDFPQFIGVDRMFDELVRHTGQPDTSYPPYNVVTTGENEYVVELAVAGFGKDDLTVTLHNGDLVIEGEIQDKRKYEYLHNGISSRKFKRSFKLAEHVQVKNAGVQDGIMSISLERELPEELKPQVIAIDYKG